jgi:hypothetical protein
MSSTVEKVLKLAASARREYRGKRREIEAEMRRLERDLEQLDRDYAPFAKDAKRTQGAAPAKRRGDVRAAVAAALDAAPGSKPRQIQLAAGLGNQQVHNCLALMLKAGTAVRDSSGGYRLHSRGAQGRRGRPRAGVRRTRASPRAPGHRPAPPPH